MKEKEKKAKQEIKKGKFRSIEGNIKGCQKERKRKKCE